MINLTKRFLRRKKIYTVNVPKFGFDEIIRNKSNKIMREFKDLKKEKIGNFKKKNYFFTPSIQRNFGAKQRATEENRYTDLLRKQEQQFEIINASLKRGHIFKAMETVCIHLDEMNRTVPRKFGHPLALKYRIFILNTLLPFVREKAKTNLRNTFSYLTNIMISLNKHGVADSILLAKYYFSLLRKTPSIAFYKRRQGGYFFKMLNTPFHIFTTTFNNKVKHSDDYIINEELMRNLVRLMKPKARQIFRESPELFHNLSLLNSIGNTGVQYDKVSYDWLFGELEFCLKNLVRTQTDLYDVIFTYCLLARGEGSSLTHQIDQAFVRSVKIHGNIDDEIFKQFKIVKFFRNGKKIKKYFPESFHVLFQTLKNKRLMSSETVYHAGKMDNLGEFPSELIEYLTEITMKSFKEEKHQENTFENVVAFLTSITKSQSIRFETRAEVVEFLKELLTENPDNFLNCDLVNTFLFSELQMRYFDSDSFLFVADSLLKFENTDFLQVKTKATLEAIIRLFTTFTFSTLDPKHAVFQKLCFIIEETYLKEITFQDPFLFKIYISGFHNLYCRSAFAGLGKIFSEKKNENFEKLLKQKILKNIAENTPTFCKEYLRYYLPHMLKIMNAGQIGEGRWKIMITTDLKHKLLSVLLTLKTTEFLEKERIDHWNKIINYFIEKSKDWKFDYEGITVKKGKKKYTRSGNLIVNREEEISKILGKLGISFEREKRCLIYNVDFYIEGGNGEKVILEYDGFHHFSRIKKNPLLADAIQRIQLLDEGYDVRVLTYEDGENLEEKISEIFKDFVEK